MASSTSPDWRPRPRKGWIRVTVWLGSGYMWPRTSGVGRWRGGSQHRWTKPALLMQWNRIRGHCTHALSSPYLWKHHRKINVWLNGTFLFHWILSFINNSSCFFIYNYIYIIGSFLFMFLACVKRLKWVQISFYIKFGVKKWSTRFN